MADQLKNLFIKDRDIKNRHLDTNAVDARTIKDGSVESIHIAQNSITIDKMSDNIRHLLLPNTDIFYALNNSTSANADNPFVTREEVFSNRSNWKSAVQKFSDLPDNSSGANKENDIRLVVEERTLYLWKDNSWSPVLGSTATSSSSTTTTSDGYRKNVTVYNYDIELGQYAEYTMTHGSDFNLNRIIQVKERILGEEETEDSILFNENEYYIKSSLFSLDNALINVSSQQVLGSNSVPWDPSIVGMIAEDEEGNTYRVDRIVAQNGNLLPYVIYLDDTLKKSYTGNFYLSNAIVNNNEASLIRQKDADEFTIIKDTSQIRESASNIQVLGSDVSGITAVMSIREDNTVTFNYKEEGSEIWNEYNISYKYSNLTLPVKASKFHAAHIVTKPIDSDLMTKQITGFSGNDIYVMVYLEEGTEKPNFVSWSHNFGTPVFHSKILLDNYTSNSYEDIYLDIRESMTPVSGTFDSTNSSVKSYDYKYAIAITASVISSTSNTSDKIALWVNDDAGDNFMSNWNAIIAPSLSPSLNAEYPKVVLSPGFTTDSIYNTRYTWNPRKFSIWITYRDKESYTINSMIVRNEEYSPGSGYVYSQEEFLFEMGRSGNIYGDGISVSGSGAQLSYFSTTQGYDLKSLFSDNDLNFKCDSKYDFDVALWEDYIEPGLLYQDENISQPERLKIHLRGTPVVVACNSIVNSNNKKYEIFLTYKEPSSVRSMSSWSISQATNQYGRNIKLRVQKRFTRHYDHLEFQDGYSNADNVHIFYINQDEDFSNIPVHTHNNFGTWISESDSTKVYKFRLRNFSNPIKYLDYVGLTDYDFDLGELNNIQFTTYYGSDNTNTRGLYFADQYNACKYAIWEPYTSATMSGPGPRAGFTSFHYNGYIYIQGGYGSDGTINSTMWRLNSTSQSWEQISTENAPPRVFHLSDIVENVAYRGSLDFSSLTEGDIVPTAYQNDQSGFPGGLSLGSSNGKPFVWVNASRFNRSHKSTRVETVNSGSNSSGITNSLQSFFEYYDSKNRISILDKNDVESTTRKIKTTEGYRDSIINYEFYNLTSGSHGIISDISEPVLISGNYYVCIQLESFITEGSRSTFQSGDMISISYPGKPAYDQVIMYGGGAYNSSRSNGYPDDVNNSVVWPPDSVETGGDSNIGDQDVYSDARTIFAANIDSRSGNVLRFSFIPVADGGASNAPVPCITGGLIATDYTRDSIGDISSFPNFVLINRSNAYRFKLIYQQNTSESGRPFTFLGSWSKLDPVKSSSGEPLEGLSAWKGTKLNHYGGIKPAPAGHSDNAYEISPSIIYFGGFTKSDFQGYYSNSLLVINSLDVNLGWSLIESTGEKVPSERCGNAIAMINSKIEDPEKDTNGYIQFYKQKDTDYEVWIVSGNNNNLDNTDYDSASSKDDTWKGTLQYERKRTNTGILSTPKSFTSGNREYEASVDIDLNSSLGSFIVPNGLRTSNNLINSIETYPNTTYSSTLSLLPVTASLNYESGTFAGSYSLPMVIEGESSGAQATIMSLSGTTNGTMTLSLDLSSSQARFISGENILNSSTSAVIAVASGTTYNISFNKYLNDRYTNLSINDPSVEDYYVYNGTQQYTPNWISFVTTQSSGEISGDSRTETNRGGDYFPADGSAQGERRWTVLAKLTLTIPEGPGSGDHTVYVGVYNNGIKSYVEYFLPENTQFAFGLAFLELSGGLYNEDESVSTGKSWIDVGTGTLHLQIRNSLNQPLSSLSYPYISKIENVNYVELTGVEWADMTSEIGVKPMKNTWGSLIAPKSGVDNIVYFGGRTHNKVLIKDNYKWYSPSIFVQNEKSEQYLLSEIDGSTEDKWLPLKHGNIVKNSMTAELGDIVDYNVDWQDYYSAWGTAKLILNNINSNDRKPIYYLSFNVKPIITPYMSSGTSSVSGYTLHSGLGYINFESLDYPVALHGGVPLGSDSMTGSAYPLIEGELNYETGKIKITQAMSLEDISPVGQCEYGDFISGQYQMVGDYYPSDIASYGGTLYAYVAIGLNAGIHEISSISGTTVSFTTPVSYDQSSIPLVFVSAVPTDLLIDDAIFEIADINYHTYENPNLSYYDNNTLTNEITRYSGDKIGGEYSGRISSWIYSEEASIDSEDISFIQDDRALTLEYDIDNYDTTDKLIISDGYVATTGSNTFTSTNSIWTTNLQTWILTREMILYIPNDGYYKISAVNSNTELVVDTYGPYGGMTAGSGLSAVIFENKVTLTDIKLDAPIPNSTIEVPTWMINEMLEMQTLYQDGNSSVIADSVVLDMVSDLYNVSYSGIINIAQASEVQLFGKIIFRKNRTSSSSSDIEWYQYFIQKDDSSSIRLVGGDQILLNIDGSLQSYDAETDSSDLSLVYVSDISEYYNSTTGSYDIEYTFGVKNSSTLGSIADVTFETNILYYNNSSMNIPTEIYNPDTYLLWQGNDIKVLFSFDEGNTWKKYDSSNDLWIAVNAKDIMNEGMDINDLFDIISWKWSGWNNFFRRNERNISRAYVGFIEGSTESIKILVGVDTEEPSHTPSFDGLVMNFYKGSYWEPKSFLQEGTQNGDDSAFIKVKMMTPTSTKIINEHASDSSPKQLKATILLNENVE